MISIFIERVKLQSPNVKKHWGTNHKANKKLAKRIRCHFLAHRSSLDELSMPHACQEVDKKDNSTIEPKGVKISILYFHPRAAQMDMDNLISAAKPIRDTVADLLRPGLAPGLADSDKTLEWIYLQEKGNPKEYSLKIIIEPKEKNEIQD